MEPFFDRYGHVVGWLHPDNIVVDGSRQCRAFVQGGNVYSLDGGYLGEFQGGFLWDQNGAAVGFVRDAAGGPPKPVTRLPPLPPLVRVPRVRLCFSIPAARMNRRREWSSQSFDTFLGGGHQTEREPAPVRRSA